MLGLLRPAHLRRLIQVAPSVSRPIATRHFATYPSDRKYHDTHEWAKLDGDIATIGITDYAQSSLGEIVFAELPKDGDEIDAGERVATVESVKASADILAPVKGHVVDVNAKLEDTPDLINSMPHDDGWLFRVKVSDAGEVEGMLSSEDYEKSLSDAK